MKSRAISTLIGLGLSICFLTQAARADTLEIVVKYGGTLAKAPGAIPREAFQGVPMPNLPGSQPHTFAIPNSGPAPGKPETYAPDPKIEAMIKPFQAGDLIDIVYGAQPKGKLQGTVIISATAYKAQPGEDDPHAWVFDESFPHKEHGVDIHVITLMKYKQKSMFLVPTHSDPANPGDTVPDDIIMGIAGKLHQGQVVFAQVFGNGKSATVKLLAPWANHFTGKFVKLDPAATVDPNDNTTGPAVDLTDASGKAVTAIIPGSMVGKKWMPDGTIVGQAKHLKPDVDVEYITADSGDSRIWLVSIGVPKPEPKTAAKPAGTRVTQ